MAPHIEENGLMINSMDLELKNGQMVLNMKAIFMKELNKGMDLLLGLMVANMKENLKEIILKDLDIILGWMDENLKVHGKTTKCMVEVY